MRSRNGWPMTGFEQQQRQPLLVGGGLRDIVRRHAVALRGGQPV